MQNNDLTPNHIDKLHSSDNNHDYYEALTPSNFNGMLSPLNQNHHSETFSQSYNQQQLKHHLQESLSVSKRFSDNQRLYENEDSNIQQPFQQAYQNGKNSQNGAAYKKIKVLKAEQIAMKQSENHHKSFSSHQLQHSLSGSGSTQPFSSPKKKFSSAISQSSNNNNISQMTSQRPSYIQDTTSQINKQIEQQDLQQEEQNDYNDARDNSPLYQQSIRNNSNYMQDTLNQQMGTTNGQHALNYQTASFGSNLKNIEKRFNKNESKANLETTPNKPNINDPMYGTFTDIGMNDANKLIISSEIRARLLDTQSNWKIRTEAIDEVLLVLQQQMNDNPNKLTSQAEQLVEFFLQLLNDQNFKIVLTTLMIINKVLSLSLLDNNDYILTSQQLGRFVPHFVKKLGDSKNIIRQEGVRALITVYEIMKKGDKAQNNLVALILPYLNNSSNWHIREELLNVIILCFLKSRNFYDFDSMQIIEALVQLMNDQKDKVRIMVKEALATYASIGNKFSFKEIIFQICEPSQKQDILERLDQDQIPFINQDGALELPYLEFIDNQAKDQTVINSTNNGQFVLPNLSRRESMSSNTQNGIPMSINSSYQRQSSRGNSSGRRVVPPSANSMQNYVNQGKRTVSANNLKQEQETYYDQSPSMSHKFVSNDKQIYQNNTHFGFLPSLNKAQSQQYQNSYYSQNNSFMNAQVQQFQLANNNQQYNQQLKLQKQMHSDHQVYSANGQRQSNQIINHHNFVNQNSFKIPSNNDNKLVSFGNLHKGVHSANIYSQNQQISLYNKEDVYQQNQGFLNQLQQNQNLFDQNQQQQAIYSAQKQSRQHPYDSKQSQNGSQQQSRTDTRDGVTPQKKLQNQNTFYSDGSFTTTTTSIPDKIKQLRANKRFNVANINDQSKRNIQIIGNNNANLSYSNNNDSTDQNNNSTISEIKNQYTILGGNQRGPVKAKHHAIQQQENVNNTSNIQPTSTVQDSLQDLCIDNRRLKKNSVLKNKNDLQEIVEETKMQDFVSTKKDGTQMRRTNFGQTDFDDNSQKYVATDDLEPLDNPDKDLKRALNSLLSSEDWSKAFDGCCIVRRICKHHSSLIVQQSGMIGGLITQIIKIADSLRSSLSKIALLTLNDMLTFLKRCMEPYLDSLCKVLIKKSADTNTFISEAAEKSLLSMCQNCQDTKVLSIVLASNVNAKSNQHRQKICKCLQQLIKVLGNSILFFKENDKLLSQTATYLSDACPEVRNIAKQSFIDLSQAIMGQNDREKLLQRVLNEAQLKRVKDLLDKEPAYLTNNSQLQSDFVIINANQHFQQNKKLSKTNQSSKGQLRSASLNKTNQVTQGDQPLNIQATKIIKPSQIKKRASQSDVSNITPQKKEAVLDSFFIDTMKDLILQTQIQDWKQKLDSVNNLYEFIEQNAKIFQSKTSTKFVELSDTLSLLMSDQNVKIQQLALDQFLQILPRISNFIEQYIVTFYQALTSNLTSSNTQVKKLTESILNQINEVISDKILIVQPLLSSIQFSSNVRQKPLLIDQLTDMIPSINEQKQQYIIKSILPVSLKLLDDNRSEVKSKTEKLLKTIYQSIGQQMLDSCPQPKLQKLCDIVLSNAQISGSGGIATFGAQSINGLLKGANLQ